MLMRANIGLKRIASMKMHRLRASVILRWINWRNWLIGGRNTIRKRCSKMSTGEIILTVGIVLIVFAFLIFIIGECLLHYQKKKVLRQIDHEYR